MSTFAFGTYRITDENPLHIEALKEAIESGVRLIDTAGHYTNGGAERAIAKVMAYFEDSNEIKIISKYIPSDNVTLHEQLTQSLQRLELHTIDCYLVDTPKNSPYEEFVLLEKEVKEGKIGSYGISFDGFEYKDLLFLAQKAAKEAGNTKHSFSTIELPINILQQEGLTCAVWAKKQGLRVLSSCPLNAQKGHLMYRLADYKESKEYYHYLNELLEFCSTDTLKSLKNLIEQMDSNRHKFGWIGEYDIFVSTQILPHIKMSLEKLNSENLNDLLYFIERFLQEYRAMVAYECSIRIRSELKNEFQECKATIQECALEFLCKQGTIDYILIGMKKPSYVQEIMDMRENICLD